MQTIDFEIKNKPYQMPNCWELLSPDQFINLARLLRLYAEGRLSIGDVRFGYVKHFLKLSDQKVRSKKLDNVTANIYVLMSLVDFIFKIQYAPEVWNKLSKETRRLAAKTEPYDLPDTPEARYLMGRDYSFVIDASFACQLIPCIKVAGEVLKGYTINTDFGKLSCSLTAQQYIDASECLFGLSEKPETLPLLGAILYCPDKYNADWAHTHAKDFVKLPVELLEAIALNYQAFVILLFEKTDYSILKQKNDKKIKGIFTSISAGLYNLSTDGYGNLDTVSEFSVITYLDILRSKLIESVRTMHQYEQKPHEIAEKTGLDLNTINSIIN